MFKMASYYDKKKLIDENSDLYISPYDKTLDAGSLAQIIDAKKTYKNAEKNGDEEAKQKANKRANSIRENAGSYNGGYDGSEYNKTPKDYEINNIASFQSKYDNTKDKIVNNLSGRKSFSYNPEDDPLYETYRSLYLKLGRDAYDRAMADNSLRMGGMTNSSAQSAAMQALSKYNSMLSSKIPDLYKLAYEKYNDEGDNMYKLLDTFRNLDSDDYTKYRDKVKDFQNDRDYFYKKDKNNQYQNNSLYKYDSDLEHSIMRDTVEDKQNAEEFEYEKYRDGIEDSKWREQLNSENEKNQNAYSIDKLNAAIRLAQALYGKVPISANVIMNILSMIG